MAKAGLYKSTTPGWVRMVTPYSERFLDDFRLIIPQSYRQWVPAPDKYWLVNELVLKECVDILGLHFDNIETDLTGQVEETNGNLFRQVFSVLPSDYVDKVFKVLAQALHPDHGGSNEQMKQLNEAYREAKK